MADKEFCLSDHQLPTSNAYGGIWIRKAVKKLIEQAKDNRTISAAREEDCVLIETLVLIVKEIFGEKLI